MKRLRFRKGAVLITVLALTMSTAIVVAGVLSYTSYATRATEMAIGRDLCRLAAQGEIELAKTAIYNVYRATVGAGAKVITASIVNSNKAKKAPSAFDWFEAYSGTTAKRTIGTGDTSITFDESVDVNGCTVRTRIGRVDHPSGAQYADVTIVAEAVRRNPGGSRSISTIMETFRFAQQRSMVFNYAYFVNNYGWFEGSGGVANGDVRANGNMYLDSRCLINGHVYASKNTELGVNGDITNYGKMDSERDYKKKSYGTTDRARPLSVKGGDGGYVPPEKKGNTASAAAKERIHANQELPIEMPYIGDLISENSDYLAWAQSLHAADSNMSTLKYTDPNGQRKTVSVIYDGVGPSGLTTLDKNSNGNKSQPAPDYNSIVLVGTASNPIEINGPVIIPSDVIISGYVKGQGTIYSGRNIHIVGDIKYVDPPKWTGRSINRQDVVKRDMLGLMAKGNIVLGDYTQRTWGTSVKTYLTQQPYVQRYACDTSDAVIGYPSTFGGSYMAEEYVGASDFNNCQNAGLATFVPGGYNQRTGRFGKMVKTLTYDRKTSTTTESYDVSYNRRYYESVCDSKEISSRCTTINQIDAILYNNHGVFGKVGNCSINGSMVCRNEGINYSGSIYFNWDVRLYSGCAESVDNDSVGLAKGSDNTPHSLAWMELPQGIVRFN